MTTCLRTFALHNLHPKLSLIKGTGSKRSSAAFLPSSAAPATKPHPASTFLYEFLEPGLSRRCRSAVDLSSVTSSSASSWTETRNLVPVSVLLCPPSSSSSENCHSYDPRMAIAKPLSMSADDIILACGLKVSLSRLDNAVDDDDDVYRDSLSTIDVLPHSIGCWHRQCTPLSEYEKSMILSSASSSSSAATSGQNDPLGKPTDDQLNVISQKLGEDLPRFFTVVQDYRIYHNNLVFQNNIRGVTTYGLHDYIRQLSMLRMIGHLKFAFVKLEVLKMTKHSEDGTVRVRWRIQGVPGFRIFFQLWKFRIWRFREMMRAQTDWYDAISTFYVGGDGLIHRHVCDKMIPDEQKNEKVSNNLAAKLALLLGAIPRPSVDELGAMVMAFSRLQSLPNWANSPDTTPTASTSTAVAASTTSTSN